MKVFKIFVWIFLIANVVVLLVPAILTPLSETFGFQNINSTRLYQIVGVIDPIVATILAIIGVARNGKEEN